MKPLLQPGEQTMWWCPNCGHVLHKPMKIIDDDRFHSWKCREPMRRMVVTLERAAQS